MNNEIILRCVYGKVNQAYYIQPCPNPKTGKLPDCVKTVNSLGDMILSEKDIADMNAGLKHFVPADKIFTIVDGTTYDLDDVVDKANWEAIEFCQLIAKDRFQRDASGNLLIDGGAKRYGVAVLYVERPGEISKVRVDRKQLIHRACDYIYNESNTERVRKAKVLGRNLANAVPSDVLDFLIEQAEKNPNKVINLYESEDWKMQLFIMEAIERGVIRTSEGIYKYDDKMLGGSLEATVTTLRDVRFKKILESIRLDTYPELRTRAEITQLKEDSDELLNEVFKPESPEVKVVSKTNPKNK